MLNSRKGINSRIIFIKIFTVFFRKPMLLLLAQLLYFFCSPVAAQSELTVVSRDDVNARYAIDLIRLGLDKAEYPYRLNIIKEYYSEDKLQTELTKGTIDINWIATNAHYEELYIPVRVPLFKGLLGYRILIVHNDNKNIFSTVKDLEDLKSFTLGQGRTWADSEILRANGLKVETGTYQGLFMMTDGKRFDGFPRGIHEPWAELEENSHLKITIDENIVLTYKMPFYLFVTPGRPELAAALEQGLLAAIADGSFDKKFFNEPFIKKIVESANLQGRTVIELKNPGLPPKTPVNNPALWFDITKIGSHN